MGANSSTEYKHGCLALREHKTEESWSKLVGFWASYCIGTALVDGNFKVFDESVGAVFSLNRDLKILCGPARTRMGESERECAQVRERTLLMQFMMPIRAHF